jgi:hypothetical protein
VLTLKLEVDIALLRNSLVQDSFAKKIGELAAKLQGQHVDTARHIRDSTGIKGVGEGDSNIKKAARAAWALFA